MPKWVNWAIRALLVAVGAALGGWIALQPWAPGVRQIEGSTLVSLGALAVAAFALWTTRQERRAALRAELFKRRLDVYHNFVKAAETLRTRYFSLHRPRPDHDGVEPDVPGWLQYPEPGSEEWWRENRETHRWLLEFQEALQPLMMVLPNEQVNAAGKVCTAAAYWRECILGLEGRGDRFMDPTNSGLYQFGNALFDLENSLRAFNGMEALTAEIATLVNAREPTERKMYEDPFAARVKQWQEEQRGGLSPLEPDDDLNKLRKLD